jgi:glycosyltransferase involved in cell wall biosynthesis
MKILIMHNQLWSQYKSIVFEKINQFCLNNGDELLVLQTSICERSRKDLIDFDVNNFNYRYDFVLLNNTYLENANPYVTTFKWLKYLFKFRPNVVNLTGYSEPGTFFVLLICKFLKIKTIITNESVCHHRSELFNFSFLCRKIYKTFLFYLADYFFSYGLSSNDFLFRHKVAKVKILSFLNSFDSERLEFKPVISTSIRNNYFLFVGRIAEEKNIEFLIQFAINLNNINSSISLKVIGDGPEFDFLNSKINMYQLTNIQLLGSVKWNKLGSFYTESLGLVLPSYFEPWGMVANEAFFYNVPVICSKFCGCANDLVINNFNGIILKDFFLSFPDQDFTLFIDKFLNQRDKFIANIKSTNHIFEPNRLSNDQYLSFKKIA